MRANPCLSQFVESAPGKAWASRGVSLNHSGIAQSVYALDLSQKHLGRLVLHHHDASAVGNCISVHFCCVVAREYQDLCAAAHEFRYVVDRAAFAELNVENDHVRLAVACGSERLRYRSRGPSYRHAGPLSLNELPKAPKHVFMVIYQQYFYGRDARGHICSCVTR